MASYAIINTSVSETVNSVVYNPVVNVTEWNGVSNWTPGPNRVVVQSNTASIGQLYDPISRAFIDDPTPEVVVDPDPTIRIQDVNGLPLALLGKVNSNNDSQSQAPNTQLSTAEVQIGNAVTITPSRLGSKILILASVDLTKDIGTTARTSTIRVRRGITNAGTQVGRDAIIRSQGVASIEYSPRTIIAVDSPNTTSAVAYTLRGLVNAANASIAARMELIAIEI